MSTSLNANFTITFGIIQGEWVTHTKPFWTQPDPAHSAPFKVNSYVTGYKVSMFKCIPKFLKRFPYRIYRGPNIGHERSLL